MQSDSEYVYADGEDHGLRFVFQQASGAKPLGLRRRYDEGHLVTIVGRGGTGKSILAMQLAAQLLKQKLAPRQARSDRISQGFA